jgi:transposase
MRLVSLPPYAPELNPVEHIWDELREKSFGNLVFDSLDALEDHLETSLREMEADTKKNALNCRLAFDYKFTYELEME